MNPASVPIEQEIVEDFQFKELRKIDFGSPGVEGCNERYSLICTSNSYGRTFVGTRAGVYVFKTASLYQVDKDERLGKRKVTAKATSLDPILIPTPAPLIDVALSSDSLTLSVCVREEGILKIYFYDTRALSNQGRPVQSFCNIALTTDQAAKLVCLKWNPASAYSELVLVALSTGVVSLLTVKDDVSVYVQRRDLPVNAVCWSPKGKQFAMGLTNGDVVQCAPKNFEEKRRYSSPRMEGFDMQLQVSDLYWLSSYEFAIVYIPFDQNNDKISVVAFMTTQKDRPSKVHFQDDPLYLDATRTNTNKFHFAYIPEWDVLTTCCNNSVDTVYFARDKGGHGVTGDADRGSHDDYHGDWWQWDLDEKGTVILPHDSDGNESYPVGVALDYTSQEVVPISDSENLPPSPLFLMYTDLGVLCSYTVINTGCTPDKISALIHPVSPLPNGPVRQPVTSTSRANVVNPLATSNQPPTVVTQPPSLSGPSTSVAGLSRASYVSPLRLPVTNSSTPLSQSQVLPASFGGGLLTGLSLGTRPSLVQNPPNLAGASVPFGASLRLPSSGGLGLTGTTTMPTSVGQPRTSFGQTSLFGGTTGQLQSGVMSKPVFGQSVGSLGLVPLSSNSATQGGGLSMAPTTSSRSGLASASPMGGGGLSLSMGPPLSGASLAQRPPLGGLQPWNTSTPLNKTVTGGQLTSSTQPASGVASTTPMGGGGLSLSMGPPLSGASLAQRPPLGVVQPLNKTITGGQPTSSTQPTSQQATLMSPSTGVSLSLKTQPLPGTATSLKTQPFTSTPMATLKNGPVAAQLKPSAVPNPSQVRPQVQPQRMQQALPKPQPTLSPATAAHQVPISAHQPPQSQVRPQTSLTQTTAASQIPKGAHPIPSQTETSRAPPSKQQDDTESLDSAVNQELVEARFAADIRNEIESFSEEMDSLQEEVISWVCVDNDHVEGLGSTRRDLVEINKDTDNARETLLQETKTFKKLEVDCDNINDETLKGFEMCEEARTNTERKQDPKYASLLKVRPLDSYSTKRLNDVRASFLQVSRAIDEVNSQLDAQLERKHEERRQRGKNLLKAPSIQTVYSTLRDQHRIVRLQNSSLVEITGDMKKLKLIPNSWQPAKNPSPRKADTNSRNAQTPKRELDQSFGVTPSRSRSVGGEKMDKLRECLSSIERTPVRRVQRAQLPAQVQSLRLSVSANTSEYQSGPSSVSGSTYDSPDGPPSVNEIATSYRAPLALPTQSINQVSGTRNPPRQLNPSTYSTSSLESLGTQYSHKPNIIVSPNQKAAVHTSHGYKKVSEPTTPQLSRRSSGPDLIASSQGQVAVKDTNGYTGYPPIEKTVQQPDHVTTGTGTVHWGSPTKPESKAQPQSKVAVSLVSTSVKQTTPPREYGGLVRTAPHSDLSQIKPSDEVTSLVPNTSLSVPNIAPTKPEMVHPASQQKSIFSFGSSPQVQFGASTGDLERVSEKSTLTSSSALTSMLLSKPPANVVLPTSSLQQPSLSTKQTGSLTSTTTGVTTTTSVGPRIPSFNSSMSAPGPASFSMGNTPFLFNSKPSFTTGATNSGAPTSGAPSLFGATGSIASSPFQFQLGSSIAAKPLQLSTPSVASGSFVLGSTAKSPFPTTPSSTPALKPVNLAASATSSGLIFGSNNSQKFEEVSKNETKEADKLVSTGPPSTIISKDTIAKPSVLQVKKDVTETDPSKSIQQIDKTQQPPSETSVTKQESTPTEQQLPAAVTTEKEPAKPVLTAAKPTTTLGSLLSTDHTPKTPVLFTDLARPSPNLQTSLSVPATVSLATPTTPAQAISSGQLVEPVSSKPVESLDQGATASTITTGPSTDNSTTTSTGDGTTLDSATQETVSGDSASGGGDSGVSGDASGGGDSGVSGDASGHGESGVSGDASGRGESGVNGDPGVSGDASGRGESGVSGDASGRGESGVSGDASGRGDASVSGDSRVSGGVGVSGDPRVSGGVSDDASVSGDPRVSGGVGVSGDSSVGGEVDNTKPVDEGEDEDAMMGDTENDMEPVDVSTGQNKPFAASGLGLFQSTGFGGLGGKPSSFTSNPFGTPSTSIVASPPTQSGLLRSSAFGSGLQPLQTSPLPAMSGFGGGLSQGANPSSSDGATGFGQKAAFGSPSSIGGTPAMSSLQSGKLFGSGGAGGQTAGAGLFGNQSGGSSLSFGSLATGTGGTSGSGFGGTGGGTSGPGFGGLAGGTGSMFGGTSTGIGFGGVSGGSTGSGFSGGVGNSNTNTGSFGGSSFSGWRS